MDNDVAARIASLQVIMCLTFDHRATPQAIAAAKAVIIACPAVFHSVELSGTFDFMFEAEVPDMAAYNNQLSICAEAMAKLVSRYEANFVCNRFVRSHDKKRAVWVPDQDGMVRIDCSKIDKVTAEGDYMRVHSAGQSWMLHSTMGALVDRMESQSFVRLHRSILVHTNFIERLTHNQSHWIARLNDGTLERVAKANVVALLASVRNDSSKCRATSPMMPVLDELSLAS